MKAGFLTAFGDESTSWVSSIRVTKHEARKIENRRREVGFLVPRHPAVDDLPAYIGKTVHLSGIERHEFTEGLYATTLRSSRSKTAVRSRRPKAKSIYQHGRTRLKKTRAKQHRGSILTSGCTTFSSTSPMVATSQSWQENNGRTGTSIGAQDLCPNPCTNPKLRPLAKAPTEQKNATKQRENSARGQKPPPDVGSDVGGTSKNIKEQCWSKKGSGESSPKRGDGKGGDVKGGDRKGRKKEPLTRIQAPRIQEIPIQRGSRPGSPHKGGWAPSCSHCIGCGNQSGPTYGGDVDLSSKYILTAALGHVLHSIHQECPWHWAELRS
jgi:hypothetical protein